MPIEMRLLAPMIVTVLLTAGCSPSPERDVNTSSTKADETLVTARDFRFDPATIELEQDADEFAFKLVNEGTVVHNLSIRGSGFVTDADVQPGGTNSAVQGLGDVRPATYEFFCKYHESQGMRGSLTIP